MNIGGHTATGPREANEDNFYYLDFSDLDSFVNGICAFAMVSDGMGGYQGGDVASGLAVACAKSYLGQLIEMADGNQIDLDAPAALAEIVQNAHESILSESTVRGNLSMGATFVGAFVSRTHAWIGHVGDSRAYLVHEGRCRQLTEDHSQVGRLLSRGVITEEEAQNHPDRNRIERALGFNDARPDIMEVDLVPGDALLLCSDGVYTVLDVDTLGSCVTNSRDAAIAAERAVKLALRHRTDDNSTAVVVANDDGGAMAGRAISQTVTDMPAQQGARQVATAPNGRAQHRSQAYGRYSRADSAPWARVLPFVLVILLVGASVVMGMRGCEGETSVSQGDASEAGPSSPTPADQSVEAQPGWEPSADDGTPAVAGDEAQGTAQQPEDQASATAVEGFASYTLPAGSEFELKYVDANGLAELFSYDPIGFIGRPVLLPGVTVTAKTSNEAFGRFDESGNDRAYQQLSDTYLEELKGDVIRAADGATQFDSELSGMFDPTSYSSFVNALARYGAEEFNGDLARMFDSTIAHLAIDSMIDGEQ